MSEAQLVVVGTPIGNLSDWSPRGQQVLGAVGLIACEDTRRTGSLLAKHGIANPGMVVMNEHTEQRAIDRILASLAGGDSVAVVTDAGMPTISDPGALAVAAAAAAGYEVVVVPGPTAVSASLALSGFAGGRYVFEGFLPRKGRERAERLTALSDERRMIVLYEAPHRIERTLTDLAAAIDPDRACVVAREITKLHESVWRGTLGEAAVGVGEPRGEYVVVVDEAPEVGEVDDETLLQAVEQVLAQGLSTKDAARQVADRHGVGRRRVYELVTSRATD
jgi:16S rRNA (cytidine1402-2'-O)-methyltransferase